MLIVWDLNPNHASFCSSPLRPLCMSLLAKLPLFSIPLAASVAWCFPTSAKPFDGRGVCGFLLVDANNAINEGNRTGMCWTVQHECRLGLNTHLIVLDTGQSFWSELATAMLSSS
jgi:hypothetical protein